jgi:hypothetical protein
VKFKTNRGNRSITELGSAKVEFIITGDFVSLDFA